MNNTPGSKVVGALLTVCSFALGAAVLLYRKARKHNSKAIENLKSAEILNKESASILATARELVGPDAPPPAEQASKKQDVGPSYADHLSTVSWACAEVFGEARRAHAYIQ